MTLQLCDLDLVQEDTKSSSLKAKECKRIGCLCPRHLGEVVAYFCEDCLKAGCTLCFMIDHHKHKAKVMLDRESDEGSFGQTGIFFPPEFTIDGLLSSLNEDLQTIDLRSETAQDQVKACVTCCKSQLEINKKVLIDHINAVKKAKLNFLQEQQKQLHKTRDELASSFSYAKKFLESDDKFSLLCAEKEITKRLAELNEKCYKMIVPTQSDWNLDKIKMIRDGKYVNINKFKEPPNSFSTGIKTVNDLAFKSGSVSVSLSMESEMFQAFVRTCCKELGQKYWLRTK